MEIEKFAGMALPDELLEKISGGYTMDVEGENCDWLVYHLELNES